MAVAGLPNNTETTASSRSPAPIIENGDDANPAAEAQVQTESGAASAGTTSQADAAPEDSRTRLQTAVIIAALGSAMFLSALDISIVTVAIPTITAHFKTTVGYTWIGSAYMLSNAAAAPAWGKVSDIWGRKQVLLLAVAVFWLGSLLAGVSVNMAMLIAGRAVQGIGGGGIIILVNVCISDLFSVRKRGQYFGLMGLVWACAAGVGPVVGGAFSTHASWRYCFYINLPVSGVGFLVLVLVLKLHNPRTSMRDGLAAVDWLGNFAIIGGTLMILLGIDFGNVVFPWRSATVICLIVFGAVLIGLFAVVEWRYARFPVIPLHLFRHRVAVASFCVSFFHGFVFISGSYYLPLYFQAVLGTSPLLSGVYVLPYVVTVSVASAASGLVIRKTGRYVVFIVCGMLLLTVGFALLTDLGPTANWPKIVLFQIIAAVGVGSCFQSPLIALQSTLKQRDVASATATFTFIRQLATAISLVADGVIFQNSMQRQHASLVAAIGQDAADLLSGRNAASSVYVVGTLSDSAAAVARSAYWTGIRNMYILPACMAFAGLVSACFVRQNTLSAVHEEHKTGLKGMKEAVESERREREQKRQDEEKGDVIGPPD